MKNRKDKLYEGEKLTDFRELIARYENRYSTKTAFIYKETPKSTKHISISYSQFVNDIKSLAKNLYNVFESSIDNIEIYKEKLKDMGALNSLMTGSGSCVYGVFKDKYQAKDAYRNLKRNYETYFCIVK